MLDPFYAFLIFAVLLALEILAAQTWLGLYFRFGIPVFVRRVSSPAARDLPAAAPALTEHFQANPTHPSIRFRPLGKRMLALREQLFENRAGVRYLPVMHSLIRAQPEDGRLVLTGYLNWYVLAALLYVAYRGGQERGFIPVAVLVVFLFVLSFAVQAGVNRRIAQHLQEQG